MPTDVQDVRIFIPRIRRQLDPGVGSASAAINYTDDMLKDVAADAVGDLIAICGGDIFPYSLEVSNIPSGSASATFSPWQWEYTVSPEVPVQWHGLIATQAAIQQLYSDIQQMTRTKERIQNEGSLWEYETSVNLRQATLRGLIDQRDRMCKQLAYENPRINPDYFVSLLHERTPGLSAIVDPSFNPQQ